MKTFDQVQKEIAEATGILVHKNCPEYTKKSWKREGDKIIVTYEDGTVKEASKSGFAKLQLELMEDGEEITSEEFKKMCLLERAKERRAFEINPEIVRKMHLMDVVMAYHNEEITHMEYALKLLARRYKEATYEDLKNVWDYCKQSDVVGNLRKRLKTATPEEATILEMELEDEQRLLNSMTMCW